ncbi:hypothetical protein Tco_1253540 [Tanacetum coccineum]
MKGLGGLGTYDELFEKDVIPFVKSLGESSADFELGLYREVYEMKTIFQQMETEVEQCSVDWKYFEIETKGLFIENDQQARTLKPLDNVLDYACKFMTQIQELQVRRKSSTNASRSKPRSNTRNNRISRPSSSNKKNKNVEDHLMNLKSSLNKMNHVSVCNANIKNGVLNANFEFVCSTCNECLFSVSHHMYVVDYLNDVNASDRAKSKRAKKNEWKPTGRVFTNIILTRTVEILYKGGDTSFQQSQIHSHMLILDQ